MAYEIPGRKLTLVASATVTQYKFVKAHTVADQCAPVAAIANRPLGIAQSGQASGEAVEIMLDGVSKVVAGSGGLAVGDLVMMDATGGAIAATAPLERWVGSADDAATTTEPAFANPNSRYIVGQCLVAAAEGGLATILFSTLNPAI